VSTQSIVGISRTAQNAHVRVTGTIFELLSTDGGSLVVCSMRRLPPSCATNIGPFEPISVSVSHAHARGYDDTLVVAIRAWMLPGGPRGCRTDDRRQKVLNTLQCTNFFPSDGI
jgi:hypothetical protein